LKERGLETVDKYLENRSLTREWAGQKKKEYQEQEDEERLKGRDMTLGWA
jgi:hypothetical protein